MASREFTRLSAGATRRACREALREVQQRLHLWEINTDLLRHSERLYLELGPSQGPGMVEDVAAADVAPLVALQRQ